MVWLYVVICVIGVVIALTRAYRRVMHPFWSRQPVFAQHDLHAWSRPRRQIDPQYSALSSRYYDPAPTAFTWALSSPADRAGVAGLLADSYSDSSSYRYCPTVAALDSSLSTGGIAVTVHDEAGIVGCATVVPARCQLKDKAIDVSYVDNLCVAEGSRRQGIAEKLITRAVSDTQREKKGGVYLFKREGATAPIVPLVHAKATATYAPLSVASHEVVGRLSTAEGLVALQRVAEHKKYTCRLLASASTLTALLGQGVLRVYGSAVGDVFAFRDLCVEGGDRIVECVCAHRSDASSREQLRLRYASALRALSNDCYVVVMDGLGDAVDIQEWSATISRPLDTSTSTYYLYNFIEYPHKCDEVLCLL
jgi:hypothetical protein